MDRRSFIVSAASALLTPTFLRDAARTLERTSSPLLVPPDSPSRTLYALRGAKPTGTGYFYDLWLDSLSEDPEDDFFYMTWREYLSARGYRVRGKDRALAKLLLKYCEEHLTLNGETDSERLKESRVLLDEPANGDFLVDQWKSWGSPQEKPTTNCSTSISDLIHASTGAPGSVDFIDSPSLGYYACSVEVDGCLSLSLLQGRLNELGTGLQIEIRNL